MRVELQHYDPETPYHLSLDKEEVDFLNTLLHNVADDVDARILFEVRDKAYQLKSGPKSAVKQLSADLLSVVPINWNQVIWDNVTPEDAETEQDTDAPTEGYTDVKRDPAQFAKVEKLVQHAIGAGKRGTDVETYTAKGITYEILKALGLL